MRDMQAGEFISTGSLPGCGEATTTSLPVHPLRASAALTQLQRVRPAEELS